MNTEILKLLADVEAQHNIEILYACESGSRAWGFASPDSDYDIRFIYKHPHSDYLKVLQPKDNITIAIKNDLDPGGWDVRKALSLLRKSNGALSEWLHSPIVYKEKPGFLSQWRGAYQSVFSTSALYNHYRGLAKQMWQNKLSTDEVHAKSYLYCLRSTLASLYIIEHQLPAPVPFSELLGMLPAELKSTVDQLLEHKSGTGEKHGMTRIPDLDAFLSEQVNAPFISDLNKPPQLAPVLDTLFQSTISEPAPYIKKSSFTLDSVRKEPFLLFEAISGSRAYGTHHAKSDTDLRGIFAAPDSFLLGNESIDQVQDEKGDEVYFELSKYFNLLAKSNPNALEMLYMPDDCIRFKHPVMDLIEPQKFLSKQCEKAFAGYALGQIKKAKGLNKKIVNPEPEERLSLIDFCHVLDQNQSQGSTPLKTWLEHHQLDQQECGVAGINHIPNTYAIFSNKSIPYRGIFSKSGEPDILCSSIPKEERPLAWMTCNLDAFKRHCKHHKEYWEWVKKRNPERYLVNTEHNRGYDSKNMMHTLRLLEIAETIALEKTIRLRSENVDYLLRVRKGEFSYEELLAVAEEKMASITEAFAKSDLPEEVDFHQTNALLVKIRESL